MRILAFLGILITLSILEIVLGCSIAKKCVAPSITRSRLPNVSRIIPRVLTRTANPYLVSYLTMSHALSTGRMCSLSYRPLKVQRDTNMLLSLMRKISQDNEFPTFSSRCKK